jgi:hypothetical protein
MSSKDQGRIIAVIKIKSQEVIPDPEPVILLELEPLTAVCNTMVMIDLQQNPLFQIPDIQSRTIRYEQTQGVPVTVMIDPGDILKAAFEIPPGADVNVPFIFNIIFDEGETWSRTYVQLVNNTPTEYIRQLPVLVSSGGSIYSVNPTVIQSFFENNGSRIPIPDDFSLIWDIDQPFIEEIEVQVLVVTSVGSIWGPDQIYNSGTQGFHKLVPGKKYRMFSYWNINGRRFRVKEGIFSSDRLIAEKNLSLTLGYNDFVRVPSIITSSTSTVTKFVPLRKNYQDALLTSGTSVSSPSEVNIVKFTSETRQVQSTVKNANTTINTVNEIVVTRFNGINIGS